MHEVPGWADCQFPETWFSSVFRAGNLVQATRTSEVVDGERGRKRRPVARTPSTIPLLVRVNKIVYMAVRSRVKHAMDLTRPTLNLCNNCEPPQSPRGVLKTDEGLLLRVDTKAKARL